MKCGAPGGIRTRQPANYKSAALPLRHWGMRVGKAMTLEFDSKWVCRSDKCFKLGRIGDQGRVCDRTELARGRIGARILSLLAGGFGARL